MNIAVVGSGYVGLVTGACFAEFGVHVTCVDNDEAKIESLLRGEIPIYEPGLGGLVERNAAAGRLEFTTDLGRAVRENLVIMIAVGTPQDPHGRADLRYVFGVAEEVAEHLKAYKVIVTKSTVPVGTGPRLREFILEKSGGKTPFSVASNPEFLREGSAIEDFMRPNRVVIGADDEQAAAILEDLYRPLYLIETPIVTTSIAAAELVKYASNAFLAVKISYINEVADLCEKVGADVHDVARGMGLDRRIGRLFLHPGPGFGGSCFPKDTRAMLATGAEHDLPLRIVESAIRVNDDRAELMLRKIEETAGGVAGKTVAMLGLSFKPNTDDLRESPALKIADALLAAGASLRCYDPVAMDGAREARGDLVYAEDEYEACRGADLLVLATEWNQFRSLNLERIKKLLNSAVMVDLRNVYEPEEMRKLGFAYSGVGR